MHKNYNMRTFIRALLLVPFLFLLTSLSAQQTDDSIWVSITGVVQTCGNTDSIPGLFYELATFDPSANDTSGLEGQQLAAGYLEVNPNGYVSDTLQVDIPEGTEKLLLDIAIPGTNDFIRLYAYVNEPFFGFELPLCDEQKDCDAFFQAAYEPNGYGVEFDVYWNDEKFLYNDSSIVMAWDFGDGTTSNWPYHKYEEAGYYEVCLTITEDSCQDTFCDKVYIVGDDDSTHTDSCVVFFEAYPEPGRPGVEFEVYWNGEMFPLQDSTISMKWTFGDGTSSDWPYHLYEEAGLYEICLTVTDENCTSTYCDKVYVGVKDSTCDQEFYPFYQTGNDGMVYFGMDIDTADVDIQTIKWKFGDGNYSYETFPVHTYQEGGKYLAEVRIVYGDNCVFEQVLEVEVEGSVCPNIYEPWWDAGADNKVYFGIAGYPIWEDSLSNDSLSLMVSWNFGDGYDSADPFPIHTYEEPGKYEVEVHIYDPINQCEFKYTLYVWVEGEGEGCTAEFDAYYLSKNKVRFKALQERQDGVKTRYKWTFSDGTIAKGRKVTYEFSKPGIYGVCLTVKVGDSCVVEECDTVIIDFQPACDAGFTYAVNDLNLELYTSSTTDSSSAAHKYVWDLGNGDTAEGSQVSYTYQEAGAYLVCLKAFTEENAGCFECKEIVIKPEGMPEDSLSYGEVSGNIDLTKLEVHYSQVFLTLLDKELESVAYSGLGSDFAYDFQSLPFGNYRLRVVSYETGSVMDEKEVSLDPVRQPQAQVNFNFSTTSVDPLTELTFIAYPNPSTDVVNIQLSAENAQKAKISVRDMMGRLQLQDSWQLTAGKQERKLELGRLAKGVYTVLIETDQGLAYKFIELK